MMFFSCKVLNYNNQIAVRGHPTSILAPVLDSTDAHNVSVLNVPDMLTRVSERLAYFLCAKLWIQKNKLQDLLRCQSKTILCLSICPWSCCNRVRFSKTVQRISYSFVRWMSTSRKMFEKILAAAQAFFWHSP